MMPDHPLPDYDRPPLVEVVFAASVEPLSLPIMELSALALEEFGDEFPIRQEQPPMRMARESFDNPIPQLGPTLALLAGQPPIRLWLQSEDQTRLLQLQKDWLACNWQKGNGPLPYPRYEAIESFFLDTWDRVDRFASTRGGGLVPTQCELSYINLISPGELWSRHGEMHKILGLVGEPAGYLPEPEDGQVAFRFRMKDGDMDLGRLHVRAVSAFRPADRVPVIQLTMTARGAPPGTGREDMRSFFRMAHEWIVEGFAAVTTEAAQDTLWGRKR